MQLTIKHLPLHLKGPLLPIYLVSGDELLLRQEAKDNIRQAARNAGYHHYQRLEVEGHFNWNNFTQTVNSYSLFEEKTFIELYNPAGKFEIEAGKSLLAYCEHPPHEKILLITAPKLSSAQQKTRWYKAIDEKGGILPIWPIKSQELPAWINDRLHQANLKADADAIRLLAEFTEGNLLASQQAIIKLRLLFPEKKIIGVEEMRLVINDSAQFNIFELSHYCLQSDPRGVLRVLSRLRTDDTEPTLVLWLLARECRTLLDMTYQLQQGKTLTQVLDSQWAMHKPLYQHALRRVTLSKLESILQKCHQADQIIKGLIPGDCWNILTGLSLELAGVQ